MKILLIPILTVCLFFADNGWYLNIFNFLNENLNLGAPFEVFLAFVCWGIFSLFLLNLKIRTNNLIFINIIYWLFISVLLASTVGSVLCYSGGINTIFISIFRFGSILIYPILMSISEKTISPKKVFFVIVSYGVINALFHFVIFLNPNFTEIINERKVGERFGILRIGDMGPTIHFAMCYFICCMFIKVDKKYLPSNWFIYCGFILTLFINVFINQSRAYDIGFVLAIFLLGILSFKFKFINSKSRWVIFTFTFVLILFFSSFVNSEFVQSFNLNKETVDSNTISLRIEGLKFYLQELIKTKFAGIGWIPVTNSEFQNDITKAVIVYKYSPNDLGLLGIFISYGLLGILTCYLFYKKVFSAIKTISINNFGEERLMACSIGFALLFDLTAPTSGSNFYWRDSAFYYGLIFYVINKLYLKNSFKEQIPFKS